jgi:hypothetical protein
MANHISFALFLIFILIQFLVITKIKMSYMANRIEFSIFLKSSLMNFKDFTLSMLRDRRYSRYSTTCS